MQTQKTRLTEDEFSAAWRMSIPKEFRPAGNARRATAQVWNPEQAARQALGRQGVQREKQRKYVAECIPMQDGDEAMLALYADGRSVQDVSREMELPYETARLRILACHPDAKSLK